MYNLNGIKLELDEELLKEYSELTIAKPYTELFNKRLSILAKIALRTENLEEAVYLYGISIVSNKIEKEIKKELETFSIDEYEVE